MSYLDRLGQIRQAMAERGIAAYIIPSSDPHISEYLPDRYKCIEWASGFTGSAGTIVITADFAGLWTDSRYFVQANEQLAGTGYELVKLKVQGAAEYGTWIANKLKKGDVVGFDGNLASLFVAQSVKSSLQPFGITVDGQSDLLSGIWSDRPALPKVNAFLLEESITGQSAVDKLKIIREKLHNARVNATFVSSLDDIAWILNIRGQDVPCNPVVLSYVYIDADRAILFIDRAKLDDKSVQCLQDAGVQVQAYEEAFDFISTLRLDSILIDPKRTCSAIYDAIPDSVSILEAMNPSTGLKAMKNAIEVGHLRKTMINDGVALTKFFKWLHENVANGGLTEMSIADKLEEFRAEQEGFVDISFSTIAGYLDHGALPHYKATEMSNYILKPSGILLVDSGGQYRTGTTDITRVISLGNITAEEKEDYTLVLKGTIEGSLAIFPTGSKGYQIDPIARRPLWATLRNYGHGTGHGVGFFLNVHEGPQNIGPSAIDVPIEEGMITSIEPGLYREGKHGIRIENLVLAQKYAQSEFGEFMNFETLTVCYIDTDLIEKSLLDQVHVDWLNNYNQWVYELISPKLDAAEKQFLALKTQKI